MVLITGKTGEQIRGKRKSLKLSVQAMALLLNLPAENIYKWQNGTRPQDLDHLRKLEMFTDGHFDKFVNNGKLPAQYDYDEAIEQIFKRNPTDDFGSAKPNVNLAADAQAPYFTSKDLLIGDLKAQIADLRLLVKTILEQKERLSEENERLKSRVVDVGKTGGRRTSK